MKASTVLHAVLGVSKKLALGLVWVAVANTAMAGSKPYQYFSVGNPDKTPMIIPSDRATTPSYVLMGGGPDVDQAFQWMIQRAGIKAGTGGRFVIIRATGTDAYNPYLYFSDASGGTTSLPPLNQDGWVGGAYLGLSSVETLIIPSVKAANDPAVLYSRNSLSTRRGSVSLGPDTTRTAPNSPIARALQRMTP